MAPNAACLLSRRAAIPFYETLHRMHMATAPRVTSARRKSHTPKRPQRPGPGLESMVEQDALKPRN